MSIDEIMRQFTAELDVCCDALLRAGWPPSRMLQVKTQHSDGYGWTTTIALTRGIEFTADVEVFVAGLRCDIDGKTRIDGRPNIGVSGRWLVDPIPTPHPSTIRAVNPRPRPPEPTWCKGCEREISDDTCHCGDYFDDHGGWDSHAPVPMGCVCHLKDAPP